MRTDYPEPARAEKPTKEGPVAESSGGPSDWDDIPAAGLEPLQKAYRPPRHYPHDPASPERKGE